MPATFGVTHLFGLTCPEGSFVNESSQEDSVDIATVQNQLGVTVVAVPKNLITRQVSIKGKGDPNFAAVVAGGFTAGAVKVLSAKISEKNDDFPDFEISGTAYINRA